MLDYVEDLDLSNKPYQILKNNGINYVDEVKALSDSELISFKGMLPHHVEEIKERLQDFISIIN